MKKHTDADRAAAVARYVTVGSSVDVAFEFGVTPQTILNWARGQGVEVPPPLATRSRLAEHLAKALHIESVEDVRAALLSFRPTPRGEA